MSKVIDDQLQSVVQRTVADTLQQLTLDNLKAEPTGMSEGETDMAKRIKQRVTIGDKAYIFPLNFTSQGLIWFKYSIKSKTAVLQSKKKQ